MCTTRTKTGVGYPQLSAVIECADSAHGLKGHIISVSIRVWEPLGTLGEIFALPLRDHAAFKYPTSQNITFMGPRDLDVSNEFGRGRLRAIISQVQELGNAWGSDKEMWGFVTDEMTEGKNKNEVTGVGRGRG